MDKMDSTEVYELCTSFHILRWPILIQHYPLEENSTHIKRFTLNNLPVETCCKESSDQTNGEMLFPTPHKIYIHPRLPAIYRLYTLLLYTFSPTSYFNMAYHQLISDTFSPLYIMKV